MPGEDAYADALREALREARASSVLLTDGWSRMQGNLMT